MEYLFLRRRKTSSTSLRQRELLFKAAEKHWQRELVGKEIGGRKVDQELYKMLLYLFEVKQVFLDSQLSLKKLSTQMETNQTYVSNVVNRYFGCHLKEMVNSYRIAYAKELLHSGTYSLAEIPKRCGFASKSAFYIAFEKQEGKTPRRYMLCVREEEKDVRIDK